MWYSKHLSKSRTMEAKINPYHYQVLTSFFENSTSKLHFFIDHYNIKANHFLFEKQEHAFLMNKHVDQSPYTAEL